MPRKISNTQTKVYIPTDSLQLYVETDDRIILVTPSHCRISIELPDSISITDELLNATLVNTALFSDIKNISGTSLGATLEDTILELAKMIG